jgi:hypothetical protein
MAMWNGDFTPSKKEIRCEQKRVWSPFAQCYRSGKFLFLKKAYYCRYYDFVDYEFVTSGWLSSEEYMLKVLRDD